jgi:hypothetical protein
MNQLYAGIRERAAKGLFNWPTVPAAVGAGRGPYVFDEAHASVTDIAAAGGTLVMFSFAVYVASNPALLPAIPVGAPVTFLILFDTTSGAQTPLAYMEDGIGLPFTPNGLDWLVQPDWLDMRGWFRV